MERPRRIAIYGGTFDPVHRGHLEIARRVYELFEIDQFLFVPARVAPHKLNREVSAAFHRYAMLALATKDEARVRISTVEVDGPGTRYTVDTLFHFRREFGETAEIFFVLGADSWAEITSWREWRQLTTLAKLIVVTRPGYEISSDHVDAETGALIQDLRGLANEQIRKSTRTAGAKIFFSDAVMADVSASEIREVSSRNDLETLARLVTPEVAEYIRKYHLYRNRHEATHNG
jgi:nicotinate-nucleotide adenylyltransferase